MQTEKPYSPPESYTINENDRTAGIDPSLCVFILKLSELWVHVLFMRPFNSKWYGTTKNREAWLAVTHLVNTSHHDRLGEEIAILSHWVLLTVSGFVAELFAKYLSDAPYSQCESTMSLVQCSTLVLCDDDHGLRKEGSSVFSRDLSVLKGLWLTYVF